jgi:hypothetical protein
MKCTHYACRCARARELALMADRTGDPRLMYEAANLGEVECRERLAPLWSGDPPGSLCSPSPQGGSDAPHG